MYPVKAGDSIASYFDIEYLLSYEDIDLVYTYLF